MPKNEVLDILGNPLAVEGEFWYYSAPQNYGVYHAKILELDDIGRVSRKIVYEMHD